MSNMDSEIPKSKELSVGHNLRLLDFDDLYLLKHLLGGLTVAGTARKLGLTQPAITQRIRKIERVFEDSIIRKVGRHAELTPIGEAVCSKAADALKVMQQLSGSNLKTSLTIAAGSFLAHHHLWQTLSETMRDGVDNAVHIRISPDKSAISLLTDGHVDALITASDVSNSALSSISLFEEENIMVASPDLSGKVTDVDSLKEILLVETDPSFSSLMKMDLAARSDLSFKDTWFVGSRQLVLNSVISGLGVGVLPLGIASPMLASGKIVQVLPDIEFGKESYQLLYKEQNFPDQILSLVNQLKMK
jgi:DNA-binding transcriptional LysR family regulator